MSGHPVDKSNKTLIVKLKPILLLPKIYWFNILPYFLRRHCVWLNVFLKKFLSSAALQNSSNPVWTGSFIVWFEGYAFMNVVIFVVFECVCDCVLCITLLDNFFNNISTLWQIIFPLIIIDNFFRYRWKRIVK